MKKSLSLLAFLLLLVAAQAQQKTVAVYVTGEQSGVSKILGDRLVEAFSKSSDYKAVERTSSFLAEISKEQNYQRTGAVDDKEISRIGKQFGVQYVCVTDISEAFGKKYVSARLINVENAEIASAANEYSDLNSMDELMHVSTVLKEGLLGKLVVVPAGYVDLGLPSGTFWLKQSYPGEITYSASKAACESNSCQIPSLMQWTELFAECTCTEIKGKIEVKGKNGNSIILKKGYHWTSDFIRKEKETHSDRYTTNYYYYIIYSSDHSLSEGLLYRWSDEDSDRGSSWYLITVKQNSK